MTLKLLANFYKCIFFTLETAKISSLLYITLYESDIC